MRTPRRLAAAVGAVCTVAAGTAALAGCSATASDTTSAASSSTPASATSSAPPAATFPLTVKAQNGPVTIAAKPGRIVSLSPTLTEDLYAVGAGGQVVAVDADSDYPATAPKTALSGITPNVEAIARYNPSLVVASQDSGGLVAGLGKLGIPVLIEPAVATLGAAYLQIEQMGQTTGHPAQALSVTTSMKRQILAEVAKAGSSHQNLTYYWELSANPFYSVTSKTFIGQIVGLFGLQNIADKADKPTDGGYPELSQEYIVTAKPQVILLGDNQPGDGGQSPAVVAKRPGWAGIPAVRSHLVVGLNDDVASRWGPRLPQLVTEIAQAVAQANRVAQAAK